MATLRAWLGVPLVALAMSCSSHGLLGGDELETTREELTALGAIVATKPISAAFPTVTAGTTSGAFSVTADGQASYQVPIWTPAGGMGIQPSLSLAYNSSRGSGPLGVGWTLSGFPISQITRCGKSLATDGAAGPVDFTGDTYCLDGQRLLPVSISEYRTERDTFTKIVRSGSATAPDSFTAWTKDGAILVYGGANGGVTTSKQSGTRKVFTADPTSGGPPTGVSSGPFTYAWALSSVTDRASSITGLAANKLALYYTTTTVNSTFRYSSTFAFTEFLLDRIDYSYGASGATPHAQVKFFYEKTRSDASLRFISGLPIQNSKLLTRIESWGPNPSATTMLKTYWLDYDVGPVSGRPRLSTVKECDGGTPSVCMQPTVFSYEPGKNEYLDITDPTVAVPPIDSFTPFTVADINGDGKHDIIYRTTSTDGTLGYYHYRLSQLGPESANNTPNPAPFAAPKQTGIGDTDATHMAGNLETFDLDADGRSEWSFFRSPGIRTGTVGLVASRDIWRFNGNFNYLVEPTGLGQSESYSNLLTMPLYVSDLDGDGLPDTVESGPAPDIGTTGTVAKYRALLLRRNSKASPGTLGARQTMTTTSTGGTVTTYTVQVRPQWGSTDPSTPYGYNSYAADIDGSGRQALLVQDSFYTTSTPQNATTTRMRAFYVNPTNGNVETAITTLRPVSRAGGGAHYVMLDINGDGLTDALQISNQTRPAKGDPPTTEEGVSENFRINSGAGFDGAYPGNLIAQTDMRFLANSKEEGGIAVADMNQDGLPDLVLMGQVRHNGVTTRTTMQVLKAQSGPDSATTRPHLVAGDSPKLIGGAEIPAVLPFDTFQVGPMPARVGDFNGDGLMDILAIPTANNPNKLFHVYIHQGKKADLLNKVTDGFSAELTVNHAPISDPNVYQRGRFGVTVPGTAGEPTWEPNADCRYPLSCATAGMWVVASYTDTSDHGIQNALDTRSYQYAEGRTDAQRGWLGFAQVVETDKRGGKNVSTYENWIKVGSNYPYAFLPKQQGRIVRVGVDVPNCDPCSAYQTLTTNAYEYLETTVSNGLKTSRVRLRSTTTQNDYLPHLVLGNPDRDLAALMFQTGTRTDLGFKTTDIASFTAYDDPMVASLTMPEERVTTRFTYFPDDPTNWLLGRVRRREVTNTDGEAVNSRMTDYTYYSGTRWEATMTTEPLGTNDVRSTTTYTRGAGGLGQVTSVTTAATSTLDDPVSPDPDGDGIPNPSPIQRGWTATYASLDGVYPASYTRGNLVTTYAYHSGLGVLAQEQDPNGIITSYSYDGFGRKRRASTPKHPLILYDYMLAPPLTTPVPAAVISTYNSLGPVYTVQRTETSGPTTSITYNLAGHPILAQTTGGDGQPIYQLTGYTNFDGQVAFQSLPFRATSFRTTSFEYDNLNRITKKTLPDGKFFTYVVTPSTWRIAVRTTNPRGFFSDVSIDDRSRVRLTTEYTPTGSVATRYEYGVMGLPKLIEVPPATSTGTPQYTYLNYDVLGRRIDLTDVDGGHSVRSYNAFGEVVKEVDAANKITTFTRDSLGRVTQTFNNGDPGANTYTWDPTNGKGHLGSSRSFNGVTKTYTYDPSARLSNLKWTIQGRDLEFKYQYDDNGANLSRLDLLTYPTMGTQSFVVKYGYDLAAQVDNIHRNDDASSYWSVVHRTDDQRIDQELFGSGYKTTRLFNPSRGWTESILTSKAGLSSVQDLAYTVHDENGNLNERIDNVWHTTERFTYSQNEMLSQWDWISPTPSFTTTFGPSPNGTLGGRFGSGGLNSYTYNYGVPANGSQRTGGMHAVQSTTGTLGAIAMVYDGNGNQTRTLAGATVSYNSFDLPQQITGTKTGLFTYDAEGVRASKTILPAASATTTLYAGGLYERRAMPTGEVQHVFYIPGANRIVAQETYIEKPAGVFARADVLYLHDDASGSITAVTTSTAQTRTLYRYDPYGKRIAVTNPSVTPPNPVTNFYHAGTGSFYTMNLGYTGHEMDDEFGLINMRGRMYDPTLARFLSPDPVTQSPFKAAGLDRYAYVLNQPTRYTDPTGFAIGNDPWLNSYGYGYDQLAAYRSEANRTQPASNPSKEGGSGGGGSSPFSGPLNGPEWDEIVPRYGSMPDSGPLVIDTGGSAEQENSPWSNEPFTGSLMPGDGPQGRGGGSNSRADDGGSIRSSSAGSASSSRPDPRLNAQTVVGETALAYTAVSAMVVTTIAWWNLPATKKLREDLASKIKNAWEDVWKVSPQEKAELDHDIIKEQVRKEKEGHESGRHDEFPREMSRRLRDTADQAEKAGNLKEYIDRLREIAETYAKRAEGHPGGRR